MRIDPGAGRMPRVGVIGGSLVGLTAAVVLRDIGCEVDVYERSRSLLQGRGVGIVLHPTTVRYQLERGLLDLHRVSTSASVHRYVDMDGRVTHEINRRHYFTGYDALYRTLLGEFGTQRYHLGHEVTRIEQSGGEVRFSFASGGGGDAELLVAADGISSNARRMLLPGIEHRYSGYVAWRAVVNESLLSGSAAGLVDDSLTYFVRPHSHALTYPIPDYDGSVQRGRRLVNLVWYRNLPAGPALDHLLTDRAGLRRDVSIPPGAVRRIHVDEVRAAARAELPAAFAEILAKSAAPFVQVIVDVEVPQMAFGRVCLVGDAAFAVRPHAAAATAKGADDVWSLAKALRACAGDVEAALRKWEPDQLELGRTLLARSRSIGEGAQVRNDWTPGDEALAFGLRRPGDSAEMMIG